MTNVDDAIYELRGLVGSLTQEYYSKGEIDEAQANLDAIEGTFKALRQSLRSVVNLEAKTARGVPGDVWENWDISEIEERIKILDRASALSEAVSDG